MKLNPVLKKIIFAAFLGLFSTIYLIQHQEEFKSIVKEKIQKAFKETFICNINCEIKSINLFLPSLELKNVIVKDIDNNSKWQWECKNLKLHCSWIDYIFSKKFRGSIELDNVKIESDYRNGNLAIYKHINQLLLTDTTNFPLEIRGIKLNKSCFNVNAPENKLNGTFCFGLQSKLINNNISAEIFLTNGKILKNDFIHCNNLSGKLLLNCLSSKQGKDISVTTDGSFDLPILNEEINKCFFVGKFEKNNGTFQISTIDEKLLIGPIKIFTENGDTNFDINLQTPISFIPKFITLPFDIPINGNCNLHITSSLNNFNKNMTGTCIINDIKYKNLPLLLANELKIKFQKKDSLWDGKINLENNEKYQILGNFNFDEKQFKGSANLSNNNKIFLDNSKDWIIDSKKLKVNINLTNNFNINADYSCNCCNSKIEQEISSSGKIDISNKCLKALGNFNSQQYILDCKLMPTFSIQNFSYKNEKGEECINIKSNETNSNKFNAIINYQYIKNWLSDLIQLNLTGNGIIKIDGNFSKNKIEGNISMINGNILIPSTYNIVNGLTGLLTYNILKRNLKIQDLIISLYKGKIECPEATIIFDENNIVVPSYIHCPLLLKNCFINWKNDLFASISGNIIFQKKQKENLQSNGYLIIEEAQVKNNIFSTEFRKKFIKDGNLPSMNKTNDIDLNFSIVSRRPIKINAYYFNGNAQVDLKIKNTISNPSLYGSIDLTSGKLYFPYKELNIVSGSIHILPGQMNDPLINLVAKNKLRKYLITMSLTGSAQNPHIIFESSPPLSEEQIGTLLVVGSEKISLGAAIPALIVENVKNIILGSTRTHLKIEKYLKAILKPFKHIRIVPSFSDEAGSRGLKGEIEVEVGDKLRANIQKNFSSPENARFEIDYDCTDQITLRGIKDERGDLGGEIEMRWKF